MSLFAEYSEFYDILYHDKNYDAEVAYLIERIKKHGNGGSSILELGCGTGRHAVRFAQQGYAVHGIDLSSAMIEKAKKLYVHDKKISEQVVFSQGDMRSIRLGRKFDVVFSLFHVMSYQVTDHDLEQALQTASLHLHDGGLFIFDFWYGPAVLHEKPVVRVKRVESERYAVTRLTEPTLHADHHTVDVAFTVYAKDKSANVIHEVQETHTMRYLFEDELTTVMEKNGLTLLGFEEWLTGNKPINTSWGVCAIGKKK